MKVVCVWLTHSKKYSFIEAVERLAEQSLRFSPQIALRKGEALFIEIGKCHHLYSQESFLVRMKVLLRRLQLQARFGLAEQIPQALLRAKYGVQDLDLLPLATLADLVDPFSQDAVAQQYIQKMILAFTDLGVTQIGAFKKIPASELTSRFGAIGYLCQQRALGASTVPWPRWQPEERIQEKFYFPYFEFYGEMEPLLFELKKQLDQIFQRLWARGLRAQKLRVRVFCEVNSQNREPFINFDFDFLFPQSTSKGALSIIRERWQRHFAQRPILTPIEALETLVLSTSPGLLMQKDFLQRKEEVFEQWQTLVSQLCEIQGEGQIYQAELTEDRRPEKSWKKKTSEAMKHNTLSSLDFLKGRLPLRPTYLIQPEKIEIAGQSLKIKEQNFRILAWSHFVEKISGAWYEKTQDLTPSFDRHYYQVEIEGGRILSVFQTPQKNFFLHGYYG